MTNIKGNVIRIILTSIFTLLILRFTGVMIFINKYTLFTWVVESQQHGYPIGNPDVIMFMIFFWNMSVAGIMIFVAWRYFALPEKIIPDDLKQSFKDQWRGSNSKVMMVEEKVDGGEGENGKIEDIESGNDF